MRVQERLYTNEEFWEFQFRPENENKNFELIHGVLCEMPSPSPLHGWIAAEILYRLRAYLKDHAIGDAFGDGNDFILAPGLIYKPDAAFVSKARLPKLPRQFEFAPDLAVEVASPSNSPSEILEKVENYLRYGGQEVWVIYPEDRVLCVYRSATDGSLNLRKLTPSDTLEGGALLPGFALKVEELFPKLEVEK